LRLAVEKARAQNMPKDNIERAIKRGSGESKDGVVFETVFYEGYAAHGVALMVETVTENRNRTVAEVRHLLDRSGGKLGEAGSVGWQFRRISFFSFPKGNHKYDDILELAIDGGADDVTEEEDQFEIVAPVEAFKVIVDKLRAAHIQPDEAELRMVANQEMDLDVPDTLSVLRTIESLEDMDDVQNVYSNLRISEEALAAMESE
jgi:YebC/PmpR family DNA-binding regulatory protein